LFFWIGTLTNGFSASENRHGNSCAREMPMRPSATTDTSPPATKQRRAEEQKSVP
jgi:hypothetical protein